MGPPDVPPRRLLPPRPGARRRTLRAVDGAARRIDTPGLGEPAPTLSPRAAATPVVAPPVALVSGLELMQDQAPPLID